MLRIRTATAAVSALAFAGLLTVPAQAAPDLTRPERQVNAFFSQYREAVLGQNPDQDPTEVRNEFLTPDLNQSLDQWAAENNADPVFRGQNVPTGWSVRYAGSGGGHSTVILTEQWGDGSTQDVWYQVQLADLRIDGLEDPPA